MASESDIIKTEDDSCMDLSIKQIWIIVHYPESDPGKEFEIVSEKCILKDSWDYLKRGVQVVLAFGNAKVQATVVTVSDDLEYLRENFISITEEYIEKQPAKSHVKVKGEGIKVSDKATQTDEDASTIQLLRNYADMKRKHEIATQEIKRIKLACNKARHTLYKATANIDGIYNEEVVDEKPETKSGILMETKKCNGKSNGETPNGVEAQNGDADENDPHMVRIGPGTTKISRVDFEKINWTNYSVATRKLLVLLFSRDVLATHSLTGKPSPAFLTREKEAKIMLNPLIVSDIVDVVSKKCGVPESVVRNAITTKCADENKMHKKRLEKIKKKNVPENCRPPFK